jgi:hypothetical protein
VHVIQRSGRIAKIKKKITGGKSEGDWIRFNRHKSSLTKQRLYTDFRNASDKGIIFIFSQIGMALFALTPFANRWLADKGR